MSVFPGENYQAPRSWAERAYHNLIYYNQPGQGGHFAAWEQPQLLRSRGPRGPQATTQDACGRPWPPLLEIVPEMALHN